jgi:DNA-binding NtrC family response regulator
VTVRKAGIREHLVTAQTVTVQMLAKMMERSLSTIGCGPDICQGDKMSESKRPRVFVVDDVPIIGFTVATILESAGYTARSFSDPHEALRAAETNCPDYLISDVMMPTVNGIDLGIQFKAIYPRVRVLLFSGAPESANLWRDAKGKGHRFEMLAKPVHPEVLLATIETLGE